MFNRDIVRSIKASLGRFIAILVIVALGTGFYAGLRMTAPDMRIAADAYYDGTHLYDLRVVSTMGLSDSQLDELAAVNGVENVMPAYETDVLGVIGTNQMAIRVHSLNTEAALASDTTDGVQALSDDPYYLNRPILASGAWPSNEGECVLSAETFTSVVFSLGDIITIAEGILDPSEAFKTRTYKVVGFVRSPYYSSSASLGVTSIGSGTIGQYMYVPMTDFKEGFPFSCAYLTVDGARELEATSQDYWDLVAGVMQKIEDELPQLESMRLQDVTAEAQADLDAKQQEFDQEQADALAELDATAAQLEAAKQQIDQSAAMLAGTGALAYAGIDPRNLTEADPESLATLSPELAHAVADYQEGRAAYTAAQAEAEEGFAEAEAQIEEAQRTLDETQAPEFFVMDRSKNYGARSFDLDAGRVDQIARVFPLMFFLVAALISLTTMTRMVEEERTLIGTYKALGYSKQRIASKYLFYALAASVIGTVIGIAFLTQLLPGVIMNAYRIMYDVPTGATPINLEIAILSAALGIGATCFAAWAAAVTTLREKPASLMLPRAPKPGRRIFLEHVGFIWKRLSFSWKVTCRNIFRYKKRLAMTLIGIAGCTALLLTGFGLSNAINDIIPKQFGEIYQYNTTIVFSKSQTAEDKTEAEDLISDSSLIYDSARAHTENVTALSEEGDSLTAMLIVPEDVRQFNEYHVMRERKTQEPLPIEPDTVTLSEKLASTLGLEIGDTFVLARQDAAGYATDERYEFTVGSIMENYVSHYIIMDPTLFTAEVGENPSFLTVFADATTNQEEREYLSDTLLSIDGVRTVGYNDEVIESYENALASVDSIVVVLIVAAAALAFAVLYNLTNINITERQREIATLRVLGFTRREMANYVFREMIILTVLGAALGLVMGIFMEMYVVVTAEVDAVMFAREIHATSFIIAFVMTVCFGFIIAFFMRGKLEKIDMVESLKSNE